MKLRWIIIALACAVTPATAGRKYGKQVRYAGIHPVARSEGGGVCHIEGPHVHIYGANKLEYRTYQDNNVFVGDPVAYGWDGPKYAYKGNHPVQVNAIVEAPDPYVHYCYINGPHYHAWEPPPSPEFKVVGDAYFYVGTPAPLYMEARPQYVGINATYEPIVYARPVVEVEPPQGWIGLTVVTPGVVVAPVAPVIVAPRGRGHVHGGVGIGVGVGVVVPVPSVSIGVHVGGPAVIVKERHHGKFKHKKFKRRGR